MSSPRLEVFRALARRCGRDLILNQLLASPSLPGTVRVRGLRAIGITLGERVSIDPMCWFSGRDISIADDTFINYQCVFDERGAPITIGSGCGIAMQTMLFTTTHHVTGPARRAGPPVTKPVTVGSGCWLGARVMVLPGVTVGDGCVIAAGSVVTADCDRDGLYAGVPARRIRDL